MQRQKKKINSIIQDLSNNKIRERDLEKVKNQAISSIVFGEVQLLQRAMNLAYFALLGDAALVNQEENRIEAVTREDIIQNAKNILIEENSSTLYYHSKKEHED